MIINIRNIPSKNKLIIFGESHGYLNDFLIQKRLIINVKPNYYIWEMLEDKQILTERDFKKFLSMPDNKDFSIISKYGDLKPTLKLIKKYKMKVIGCDLKNMGRKSKNFLKKKKLTKIEQNLESKLLKKRELHQAKIIKKCLSKTKKTIFVSVGAYHLRKNSWFLNSLKRYKSLICYPTYNGKQIFGPIREMNKKRVLYVIKMV